MVIEINTDHMTDPKLILVYINEIIKHFLYMIDIDEYVENTMHPLVVSNPTMCIMYFREEIEYTISVLDDVLKRLNLDDPKKNEGEMDYRSLLVHVLNDEVSKLLPKEDDQNYYEMDNLEYMIDSIKFDYSFRLNWGYTLLGLTNIISTIYCAILGFTLSNIMYTYVLSLILNVIITTLLHYLDGNKTFTVIDGILSSIVISDKYDAEHKEKTKVVIRDARRLFDNRIICMLLYKLILDYIVRFEHDLRILRFPKQEYIENIFNQQHVKSNEGEDDE